MHCSLATITILVKYYTFEDLWIAEQLGLTFQYVTFMQFVECRPLLTSVLTLNRVKNLLLSIFHKIMIH